MVNSIRQKLRQEIADALERSHESGSRMRFEGLGVSTQVDRASFFSEMADVLVKFGLSNPHERAALTLEPTHPVPPVDLGSEMGALGLGSLVGTRFKDAKLSLLSLAMLERYAPNSDARILRTLTERQLCLLDPLYGFIFLSIGGVIRNHCLAIDIWNRHLGSMPRWFSSRLWKNRSDNMLSGGAFAGRLIFKDLIEPEENPMKLPCPPEIVVRSQEELSALAKLLTQLADKQAMNIQVWFRGQATDYQTPERLDLAKVGIAPYSNIQESDLTPSLYRRYDDLLEAVEKWAEFVVEIGEWSYWANSILPEGIGQGFSSPDGAAKLTAAGVSSYRRGLLLQQYGSPSAYLDITRDFETAAWFATHRPRANVDASTSYETFTWDETAPPSKWPTIFVFPLVLGLHPFLDLESILGDWGALRPVRQRCGLLGGAGNLARNYCSRYIGLKIRLKPGFCLRPSSRSSYLFPPPSDDSLLCRLLEAGFGEGSRQLRAFVVS